MCCLISLVDVLTDVVSLNAFQFLKCTFLFDTGEALSSTFSQYWWHAAYLFTFTVDMTHIYLHLQSTWRIFIYIYSRHDAYLFTFTVDMTHIYLHLQSTWRIFIYIYSRYDQYLFTFYDTRSYSALAFGLNTKRCSVWMIPVVYRKTVV